MIEALVRRAGALAMAEYGRGVEQRIDKAAGDPSRGVDLVTEADLAVHTLIEEHLARLEPGVPLVSEEGRTERVDGDCFVLDPIDGTHNFAAGLPAFSISLARVRGERPEEAWLLELPLGRLFRASRTGPATCEGAPIAVTGLEARYTLLSVGLHQAVLPLVAASQRFAGTRVLGTHATSLAWVAQGRLGAHAGRGWPWDLAAGHLLVERAGGRMCRFDGTPRSIWTREHSLAGAPQCVDAALEALAAFGG